MDFISEELDDIFVSDNGLFDSMPAISADDKPEFYPLSNERAIATAEQMGLEVIEPGPNTITLDFDSPYPPQDFLEKLRFLKQFYPVVTHRFTSSKSGNLHAYVEMEEPFSDTEKIAVQAIFGSDWKREMLGLVRAKQGNLGTPSLLFEREVA